MRNGISLLNFDGEIYRAEAAKVYRDGKVHVCARFQGGDSGGGGLRVRLRRGKRWGKGRAVVGKRARGCVRRPGRRAPTPGAIARSLVEQKGLSGPVVSVHTTDALNACPQASPTGRTVADSCERRCP
jgi:hypothetical protein